MSLIEKFIQKVTYPLFMHYDGKGDSIKYLGHFDYINDLDRSALLESQQQKLLGILKHAYENTEYYKKLFDLNKLDLKSEDLMKGFHNVPLLTKKIVKENYEALIAKNIPADEVEKASTGGSTGVPMYFLRDRKCLYLRRGQELFFDAWMGYRIGKKMGYFVAGSHFYGGLGRLKYKIRNALTDRMISFDPHDITDEYIRAFLKEYNQFKPELIKCFPNALAPFVHYVKQNGLYVEPVKAISCTGETLYKQQKAMFEEVFNAEVFEKVGTRESGVYACECKEHDGLHVFTEGVYLELIKPDGSHACRGEMGKVVITDLFNKAMPLIRYEIGDMAVSGGDDMCKCGSSLPLLQKYLGRTRDIIRDSDGNPRPGYLFVEIIKSLNLNAQIQVYQPDTNKVLIRAVRDSGEEINFEEMLFKFREVLGKDITVAVEYVDDIPRDPSGKYSYVKSDVSML